MKILNVTNTEFKAYGKVLEGYDTAELLKAMEHAPLPLDEVIYEPSIEELEALKIADELKNRAYGGLPIEIGYCNGNNKKLNAVEYHRSSEIDIAVDDLILLLGKQQDITEDYTYDTAKIEAFYVPAGTAVELYYTDKSTEYIALDLRGHNNDYDENKYLQDSRYETVYYSKGKIAVFRDVLYE